MSDAPDAELSRRLAGLEDRLRKYRVDLAALEREAAELRQMLGRPSREPGAAPQTAIQPPSPVATQSVARSSSASASSPATPTAAASAERGAPGAFAERAAPTPPSASGSKAAPPDWWLALRAWLKAKVGGIPIEEFIGLNLLNKLGILMLVIGGGFFLRIAYNQVGAELKLAALTVLALAAILGGEYFLRRPNFRLFGMGLAAGGSVLLFFNAFAAYHVDATRVIAPESAGFAYVLLLLVAGGIVVNSLRYDSEAFTAFAYFLAFIAVSINESEQGADRFTDHFALLALALLAASLVLIMALRRWKFLGVLGLVGTYANFFWYATALPRDLAGRVGGMEAGAEQGGPDYFFYAFVYLSIYWLVFTASLFTMRGERAGHSTGASRGPVRDLLSGRIGMWLSVANTLCYYTLVAYIRPPATQWGAFAVTAGLGLACVVVALAGRFSGRPGLWQTNLILGAGLLALAVPFRFSKYALVFGWLVQATVLVTLGYQFRERLLRYAGYAVLLANVGAFFRLPPGSAVMAAASSGEPPLWTFDANRALLFSFMIVCFYGLQIFARRMPMLALDRVAWHSFGILATLSAFLLAHDSLLSAHQSLLLVPLALILMSLHRGLRLAPFVHYALALLVFALLSAGWLVLANDAPGAVSLQRLSLALCAAGPILFFFYLRHFAPDAGLLHESPLLSNDRVARLALWIPAIVIVSLAVYHAPDRWNVATIAAAAAGFGGLQRRYGAGRGPLMALALCALLIVGGLYVVCVWDEDPVFAERFLWNAVWFWAAGMSAALWLSLAPPTARNASHDWSLLACQAAASLVALGLIERFVPAPWGPAAVAGYGAFLAGLLRLRAEETGRMLVPVAGLVASVAGPWYWLLQDTDWLATYQGGLCAATLPIATALATLLLSDGRIRTGRALWPRTLNYFVTLVLAIACVHFVLPREYRTAGYALITLGNYYLLGVLENRWPGKWSDVQRFAPLPFVCTLLGFASLLWMYADAPLAGEQGGLPRALPFLLRLVFGLVPLVMLTFSLALHGALFAAPQERLTPFQRAGYPALLLGLVLLIMSLIDIGWWSLAWAVSGVLALVLGILRNMKLLRYGGFALVLLALCKLALWDVRLLESTTRVIVLVCVGVSLVVASYFYARFKDAIFPKE